MRSLPLPRAALAAIIAVSSCAALASAQAGMRISGTKHDFRSGVLHRDANMVTYGSCSKCHSMHGGSIVPDNLCSMCHSVHRTKRVTPLWGRANPDGASWVLWNGSTGRYLDGSQDATYLSAAEFAASGSGMCLSCHDSGIAMSSHDLSANHPLAKIVPFGSPGWQMSLTEGNASSGSNVVAETRGSVGCTSCHSMHRGASTDAKLRRPGEFCSSCHNR